MNWKWLRTGLAIAGVGALSVGCAEERAPINRVQANALAKSFFVGADLKGTQDDPEFWTQGTLVDVGYGASQDGLFTSTYAQAVARVKWQVTENLLVARLTYERIENSDGKGVGAASTDGQVVAAYRIQSHFDIRNAYNPSTGEELNVIEENGADRTWYEREYFRVDWSENLNTHAYDFDTLSLLGLYGGIDYTSLSYYVNDPDDDDAPHFDVDNGYFDVTTKAFATPKMIDLSHLGWGIDKFPACYLPDELFGGSQPVGNCNAVELTIRQSYRKVVDTDYQPEDWDGFRFQAYGAFYGERYGYSRNYGMTDQNWHRFINRYNIWERSHYYADPAAMKGEVACYTPDTLSYGEDPHADGNADGTEDRCWLVTVNLAIENGDCQASNEPTALEECYNKVNWKYGGSKCDTFRQSCTLPYRQRTSKPLAWYYSNGSTQEYYEGSEWATHEHDVAMRHAIMVSRYAECMATTANNREFCLTGVSEGQQVAAGYPVYFGQQEDHQEAKQLAEEVDDCRHGLSHADFGPLNSAAREAKCVALASEDDPSSVLVARRNAGAALDSAIGALARMPEQIVLCHSPVEANDPPVCGTAEQRLPAGLTSQECNVARKNRDRETLAVCNAAKNARMGDLRHHVVNVIPIPQTPSPWGIYTDSHDPLTGEDFAASINVWSHVNDLWSQGVIDRIRYIKGELTTADVTDGTFIKNWAQVADAAAGGQGMARRVTRKQLDQRVAEITQVPVEQVEKMRLNKDKALDQVIHQMTNEVTGVMEAVDAPSTHAAHYDATRKAALGTEVEAELLTGQIQRIAGSEGLPMEGAILDRTSPLRGLSPHRHKHMQNVLQNALADRGMCMMHEAPAPMAMTGLADVLERKFANACAVKDGDACKYTWGTFGTLPAGSESDAAFNAENFKQARAEAMRKYVAQRAHYAVITHEMGHSVGMRHNFVSSSDAYNYRPQYWQLRTKNGKNKTECTDYDASGACVGPRWFDPITKEEKDNLIWMFMHSSTMDYAGEYTQDFLGLGAYDYGAHRMFYGDAIAVQADASYALGKPRSKWMLAKMDNFGGLLGFRPQYDGEDMHYSQYQKNYELIRDCKDLSDTSAWRPASWDDSKQGAWDPLLDGFIVSVDGKASKCRQQAVDYVQWKALRTPSKAELTLAFGYPDPYYRGGPAVDAQKRVRVPYGFATDRWADLGNAAVYRHDNGADNYEVFDFLLTQQEVNHIFDDYRRNRTTFSVRSASNRILGRYNEKARDGAKGLALLHNIYKDYAKESNFTFSSLWAYLGTASFADQLLASSEVFDHFTRMYSRPQAGWHGRVAQGLLVSEEDAYAQVPREVTIPDGASLEKFDTVSYNGKYLENRLAEGKGEYDSEYTLNAGSYYDKITVPYLMAESADNFISSSRTDFLDSRYRAVSLADLFQDGYRRFVANMLTGDTALKGWAVASSGGKPLVELDKDGNKWPKQGLGHVQWWTANTQVCFPAEGTALCTAPGNPSSFGSTPPAETLALDGQVGWEQQKFLIAHTMLYIPENQKQLWLDMMKLWQEGSDNNPGMTNRIEFHDPQGRTWVAQTFGKETLTHVTPARTVQKGIAARVLEWSNDLLAKAYETTDGPDLDADGKPDWYLPTFVNGQPRVKFDPSLKSADGPLPANCNATDNSGCTCQDNRACSDLADYVSIPDYLRKAGHRFWQFPLEKKGIYD
ncbi:MAG: hypothetical protein FJ096_17875 [Deltaproteobacteria bacterium]|nr:hypothetical protein [Deltaproteobacteria bacterium]